MIQFVHDNPVLVSFLASALVGALDYYIGKHPGTPASSVLELIEVQVKKLIQ